MKKFVASKGNVKKEEQKSKILGVCICNQPFSSSAHIGTVGAHHKFKSFHGLGDLLHQILSWRERKNHRTGLAISFLAVTNIPNWQLRKIFQEKQNKSEGDVSRNKWLVEIGGVCCELWPMDVIQAWLRKSSWLRQDLQDPTLMDLEFPYTNKSQI